MTYCLRGQPKGSHQSDERICPSGAGDSPTRQFLQLTTVNSDIHDCLNILFFPAERWSLIRSTGYRRKCPLTRSGTRNHYSGTM